MNRPKHHESLAPSSFPAILLCARFQARGADNQDDEFASLGVEMHAYCRALLEGVAAPDLVNMEKSDVEDCEAIVEKIKKFCAEKSPGQPILCEQMAEVYDDKMDLLTHGTRDAQCGVVTGDIKSGLDYSNDWAAHVPQVDPYMLSQMQTGNYTEGWGFIAFIRTGKLWPYKRTWDQVTATVANVVARRKDLNIKALANPYCKFCAKLLNCPTINPRVAIIDECFSVIPKPESVFAPGKVEDPAEMATLISFARETVKRYSKRVELICRAIEEAALTMSLTKQIPHYKRVTSQGKKRIEDLEKAFALSGLPAKDFYKGMTLSLPKLGAAYAASKGMSERVGRHEVEGLLNAVIKTGDPMVALEFDPVERGLS